MLFLVWCISGAVQTVAEAEDASLAQRAMSLSHICTSLLGTAQGHRAHHLYVDFTQSQYFSTLIFSIPLFILLFCVLSTYIFLKWSQIHQAQGLGVNLMLGKSSEEIHKLKRGTILTIERKEKGSVEFKSQVLIVG